MKVRNSLENNLKAAEAAIRKAAKQKPALIALPEYFTVPDAWKTSPQHKVYQKKLVKKP